MKPTIAFFIWVFGGIIFIAGIGQCELPTTNRCMLYRTTMTIIWPAPVMYDAISNAGKNWR